MLTLENGRRVFWQWDTGQRLIVDDADCTEVHFYIRRLGTTEGHKVYEDSGTRVVDVPDELLQEAGPLVAFAYIRSEGGSFTIRAVSFNVASRPKPPDYVQGPFISNQDLAITENGAYSHGEGYTGLGLVTVDVHAPASEAVAFGDGSGSGEYAIQGETLEAIAAALLAMSGSTEKITPQEMPEVIGEAHQTITDQAATITAQDVTITEQTATIADQTETIAERDTEISAAAALADEINGEVI